MNTFKSTVSALALSALFLASGPSARAADIVETAQQAGSFQTLLKAASAAGLVEALQGDGPLTVFAPTDEAFAKVPEATLAALLRPENKDQLRAVLLYHVVGGSVKAADVVKLTSAKTLNGESVKIAVSGANVTIDGAKVLKTDIATDNGVIHVIDSVILPSNLGSLSD